MFSLAADDIEKWLNMMVGTAAAAKKNQEQPKQVVGNEAHQPLPDSPATISPQSKPHHHRSTTDLSSEIFHHGAMRFGS